tara:strand:+ start:1146 stop:1490 length:345 start_codon:yes stop_codon:yes gene_type:complete
VIQQCPAGVRKHYLSGGPAEELGLYARFQLRDTSAHMGRGKAEGFTSAPEAVGFGNGHEFVNPIPCGHMMTPIRNYSDGYLRPLSHIGNNELLFFAFIPFLSGGRVAGTLSGAC